MKKTFTMHIDASADKVLDTLISEEFNTRAEKERGALSVRYLVRERSDDRIVFEVMTEGYKRGLTGVDKSQTEFWTSLFTWTKSDNCLRWSGSGEKDTKVVYFSGCYSFCPEKGGVTVTHEVEVVIKIPLLGKKISRIILKEFENGNRMTEEVLNRILNPSPPIIYES